MLLELFFIVPSERKCYLCSPGKQTKGILQLRKDHKELRALKMLYT